MNDVNKYNEKLKTKKKTAKFRMKYLQKQIGYYNILFVRISECLCVKKIE